MKTVENGMESSRGRGLPFWFNYSLNHSFTNSWPSFEITIRISASFQASEHLTYFIMNHQIRFAVHGCRIAVDQHKMLSMKILYQPSSRIYRQAGPGYDHQIRLPDHVNGAAKRIIIQPFLVQHHIWFNQATAGITVRNLLL